SRRRHTRFSRDWSSDVCSSDLELKLGEVYKYHIHSNTGERLEKAEPFALVNEQPPHTASVVGTTWYQWNDQTWMRQRQAYNALDKPFAVYEMHIGSWLRDPSDPERFLSYREIADRLVPYLKEMGFTHVEFMP